MSKPKLPVVVERKLGRHQALGLCHPNGKIEIDPRLTGKLRLDTLIHEYLHFQFPCLTEEFVDSEASNMARFLWKHGVRTLDTLPARK